jgi:CTP:molybdopterin cytidylyltransferase MocA
MLRALVRRRHDAGCSLLASHQGDNRTVGPHVLFAAQNFSQFRLWKSHDSAKAIIRQGPVEELGFVPCPEAEFDVDTKQDVAALDHR